MTGQHEVYMVGSQTEPRATPAAGVLSGLVSGPCSVFYPAHRRMAVRR